MHLLPLLYHTIYIYINYIEQWKIKKWYDVIWNDDMVCPFIKSYQGTLTFPCILKVLVCSDVIYRYHVHVIIHIWITSREHRRTLSHNDRLPANSRLFLWFHRIFIIFNSPLRIKKNSFDLINVIMLWKDWWDCIENLYVEYNIVS